MGSAAEVVRVRREALAACMTCPLCGGLLREATAVAECLHTFCRECILEKINDEDVDHCPVCNIDLGCDPEEKLRPDHNLQDIRNKVFPLKRRKVDAPKAPVVTLPVKRKQRSLSSLVVNTPRVAIQTGLTGRRTKATRRATASLATSPANTGTMKVKNRSEGRDHKTEKSSASQFTKIHPNKKQNNADVENSSQASSEGRQNGKAVDKEELWKPLNCLVEAANQTKVLRSCPQLHAVKEEQTKNTDSELPIRKEDTESEVISGTRVREHSNKLKLREENNGNSSDPPDKQIGENNRRKRQPANLLQGLLDSTSTSTLHDGITTPVWFSLVSLPNQAEDSQLPQLSKNYLRIKDGSLQISSIQRYIMSKLDLTSEDEVEIACQGEPICPTTTLHGLVDLWLRNEPMERIPTSFGAAAKEFVMVLGYRRRALAS